MAKSVNEIDLLLELFPYSIVLDTSLCIHECGISIEKIIGHAKGVQLLDCFQIQRPYLEQVNHTVINAHLTEGFYIRHIKSGFVFRGQFRHISGDVDYLMFLGSLWVMDVEQLKPYKLHIDDFPAHDPTFDYLHVLKQADIHKTELTDLIKKIDNQSVLIKKANTALNLAKTQLESIFNEMSDVVYSIKLPQQEVLFITPSASMLYEVDTKDFLEDFSLWKKCILDADKQVIKDIYIQLK
jgi:hypothetical protein